MKQILLQILISFKQNTFILKITPCLFLTIIIASACSSNTQNQPSYLRWVGDIESNSEIDDPTFTLCHGDENVAQYFNFDGIQYQGEKAAITDQFRDNYQPVNNNQSGFIRIRFIVNCKGESGRFRLISSDPEFNDLQFDSRITDQLMQITQSLKGWKPQPAGDSPRDYYQYLLFKIENGALKEIMP